MVISRVSYSVQDFGDYTESYYSVQTHEGEKISQLIAGYIDIILKKVCKRIQKVTKGLLVFIIPVVLFLTTPNKSQQGTLFNNLKLRM